MVDIARHPILEQAVEVCHAIEKCGASVELTNAVMKASALLQAIDALLDKHAIAIKRDPVGGHASHDWIDSAKLGGQICDGCGCMKGGSRAQIDCRHPKPGVA